jgi:hypothetical protein
VVSAWESRSAAEEERSAGFRWDRVKCTCRLTA